MYFIESPFYVGLITGTLIGLFFSIAKDKLIRYNVKKDTRTKNRASEEFKMALLVRHDLKMGKGKVAAQVRSTNILSKNIIYILNVF